MWNLWSQDPSRAALYSVYVAPLYFDMTNKKPVVKFTLGWFIKSKQPLSDPLFKKIISYASKQAFMSEAKITHWEEQFYAPVPHLPVKTVPCHGANTRGPLEGQLAKRRHKTSQAVSIPDTSALTPFKKEKKNPSITNKKSLKANTCRALKNQLQSGDTRPLRLYLMVCD